MQPTMVGLLLDWVGVGVTARVVVCVIGVCIMRPRIVIVMLGVAWCIFQSLPKNIKMVFPQSLAG